MTARALQDHGEQRDRRDDQEQVGDAHEQFADPAADVAGDRPDRRADERGEQRHRKPDREGHLTGEEDL
ncbi:hypothetical protein ACU8V6_00485 [Vibrio alginolyticus]